MKFNLIVLLLHCLFVKNAIQNKHSNIQHNFMFNSKLVWEKVLLDVNSTIPKNYTILFNHLAPEIVHMMPFIEIDVENASSTCQITRTKQPDENMLTQAKVNVSFATSTKATVRFYSHGFDIGIFDTDFMREVFNKKSMKPYSFTIVYGRNATATNDTIRRTGHNSLGVRQEYDELIYFKSKNITNTLSKFPNEAFEYSGKKFITYIGFSFSSPTAIAFVNSTFIKDNSFSAVVYDLNSEHFMANVSVYGYDQYEKPDNFYSILNY